MFVTLNERTFSPVAFHSSSTPAGPQHFHLWKWNPFSGQCQLLCRNILLKGIILCKVT